MTKNKEPKASVIVLVPYVLVIAATLGLLASFILTHDKILVLQNPNYDPACNINPILSCGSVMKTEQASLLGVPNTIFGLIGFTALLTFGVLLASGAKTKRWVWLSAQVAATAGVIFMHYLFFQGVYRINAICPWCFVTWMATIPIFLYVTVFNLDQGHIKLPSKLSSTSSWIVKNHANLLLSWYTVIFLILLQHFWYYWQTLI